MGELFSREGEFQIVCVKITYKSAGGRYLGEIGCDWEGGRYKSHNVSIRWVEPVASRL